MTATDVTDTLAIALRNCSWSGSAFGIGRVC